MSVLDHLWQSTVCACLAALICAALRHAPARLRHTVWAGAGAKFLVPMSLLEAAGRAAGTLLPVAPLYDDSSTRWLGQSLHLWSLSVPASSGSAAPSDDVRTLFMGLVWLAGAAYVARTRWREWHILSAFTRRAVPMEEGREADALRRIARRVPAAPRVSLLAATAAIEPGVLGMTRPMVLWPSGLSERLTDRQLEAVLTHELCHAVRRDNLVALMQIVVETLFWFHPVVWWIGARLVRERERACDEEVLQMGADPRSYAEALVEVCAFCLRAPARCVAGIAGSPLVRRVERILDQPPLHQPPLAMRAIALAIAMPVAAAPLTAGVLDAQRQMTAAARDARAAQERTPSQSGTSPRLVREVKPQYTPEARQARIQGSVMLSVVVREDGTVGDVTVTKSLDTVYGLDDQAVKAVKQWLFEPGTKDGKPVPVEVEIEMTFTLK